jgi:hypothetical protein
MQIFTGSAHFNTLARVAWQCILLTSNLRMPSHQLCSAFNKVSKGISQHIIYLLWLKGICLTFHLLIQMEAHDDMLRANDTSCVGEVLTTIDGLIRATSDHQRHIKWLSQDVNATNSRCHLKDLLISRGYNVVECTSREGRMLGKASHSPGHTFLLCVPDGELLFPRARCACTEPDLAQRCNV